jgi:putative ABC transport system permease protein
MNIVESISAGIDEAREHRGRTFLSLVGLTLGTASIIAVLALFGGAQKQSEDFLAEVGGSGSVIVRNDLGGRIKLTPREAASPQLTWRDVLDLREEAPHLKYISGARHWYLRYTGPRNSFEGQVVATVPDYAAINDIEPLYGRFITEMDLQYRTNSTVLGYSFADSLFGSPAAALGQVITIGGDRYRVAGVLRREEFYFAAWSGNAFEYRNQRAYIPLTTALKRLAGDDKLVWLTLEATSPFHLETAISEVSDVLLRRHRVRDFSFDRSSEDIAEGTEFYLLFDFIFLIVGVISLFTGGVVIANILLASVVERVREIGTRMALGASGIDMFMHFLIQSLLITTVGGLAGVLIGTALTSTVEKLMMFPAYVTPGIFLLGLATASLVGILAGIYPAWKAARMDPVEALRYG